MAPIFGGERRWASENPVPILNCTSKHRERERERERERQGDKDRQTDRQSIVHKVCHPGYKKTRAHRNKCF